MVQPNRYLTHVDYKTDWAIQVSLRTDLPADTNLRTVATPRLQTIMDADKIKVLDTTRIVELDTPKNLLRAPARRRVTPGATVLRLRSGCEARRQCANLAAAQEGQNVSKLPIRIPIARRRPRHALLCLQALACDLACNRRQRLYWQTKGTHTPPCLLILLSSPLSSVIMAPIMPQPIRPPPRRLGSAVA